MTDVKGPTVEVFDGSRALDFKCLVFLMFLDDVVFLMQ